MRRKQPVLVVGIVFTAAMVCWGQTAGNSARTSGPSDPTTESSASATTQAATSDNKPPSGAQPVGLGIGGNNTLNISLNANQAWDSDPPVAVSSPNSWQPETSFGGTLQLGFDTVKSQTRLNYNGSAIVYPNGSPGWRSYQDFGFSQDLKIGRWTLTAADMLNYTPNSPFGGYGYGLAPAGLTSTSTPVVNPQYVPNQSVLTPFAASYFNTVVGQVEYGLSRRSSWTASGSYGIVRYPDSDLYNTNQLIASTGYNRSLTAKDSIFGTYNYSQFSYLAYNSNFTSQNVQFGYARKVTGRMSLRVTAGPEFTNAIALGANQKQIQFSGSANLAYSRGYSDIGLSYFAGATGGSGVMTGAQTENFQFTIGHAFSRAWTTSFSAGYSNNSGLVQQQSYNSVFFSPAVRRSINRNLGLSFNYAYQKQLTQSSCVGLVCGNFSRNFVGAGIDYRFRPIRLE